MYYAVKAGDKTGIFTSRAEFLQFLNGVAGAKYRKCVTEQEALEYLNGKQNNYYGVRIGRKIGVFENWEECSDSVDGYCGAQYKRFDNYEDALDYVNRLEVTQNIAKLILAVNVKGIGNKAVELGGYSNKETLDLAIQGIERDMVNLERKMKFQEALLNRLKNYNVEDKNVIHDNEVRAYIRGKVLKGYKYACAVILVLPDGTTCKYAGVDDIATFHNEYGAYFVSAVVATKTAVHKGYKNIAIYTCNDCVYKYTPELQRTASSMHMLLYQETMQELVTDGVNLRYFYMSDDCEETKNLKTLLDAGIAKNSSICTEKYINI